MCVNRNDLSVLAKSVRIVKLRSFLLALAVQILSIDRMMAESRLCCKCEERMAAGRRPRFPELEGLLPYATGCVVAVLCLENDLF
jgi:hypothetical protein